MTNCTLKNLRIKESKFLKLKRNVLKGIIKNLFGTNKKFEYEAYLDFFMQNTWFYSLITSFKTAFSS